MSQDQPPPGEHPMLAAMRQVDAAYQTLLCLPHHQAVHDHGWQVALDQHGLPHFRPPPWIDPHRTPRQHHRYRLRHETERCGRSTCQVVVEPQSADALCLRAAWPAAGEA